MAPRNSTLRGFGDRVGDPAQPNSGCRALLSSGAGSAGLGALLFLAVAFVKVCRQGR